MRLNLIYYIITLFIFTQFYVYGQEPVVPSKTTEEEKPENLEQRIEDIIEATEEDIDFAYLFEELDIYLKNKINLNRAKFDDFKRFFFLNDIQIINLLEHIRQNGKLISLHELQTIDGFDLETINMLMPYVFVSGDVSDRKIRWDDMLKNGQHQLFVRYQQYLEEQKGYSEIDEATLEANPNSRYLGSPYRLYTRYKYNYYNNISFGITAEKDPGEEFFKGSQKQGYDFYSAHFYVRNIGKIKALAIGDYHLQFGQGLTFWSGLGFGKSADAINIKKNAMGIRPYTSVDENLFMRGVAGSYIIKDFEVTGFFSKKKRDANVVNLTDTIDNDEDLLQITSLLETGFHRTPSELAKKNTIEEMIYGGNISYRKRAFSAGITAARTIFSQEFNKRQYLYNQFEFNTKENLNLGIDYSYIYKNISFFGEAGRSQNGGMAFLNGATISLDPKLSLSVLHRFYEKTYQSLYSSAFGEASRIANEKGLFLGLMASPNRAWTISAYADNFSFPWLRYRVNAPSAGFDYLIQVKHRMSRNLEMYARYRNKTKALNNSEVSNGLYFIDNTVKENYRYEIKYKVSDDISLKNRIEYVTYSVNNNNYKGFMMYQDVRYAPKKYPISLTLRYALFDTDNYDTRIYVYENDVLYASSFPSYYYKGSRTYILLSYKATRNLEFWIRWAQIYYSNKMIIGSGMDEVAGNTRNEIKAQMRIKF